MADFTLAIPDATLADLRDRLARTRLPDQPPGGPWDTGPSSDYMRDLLAHWRDGFDWRAWEARLNTFPQQMLELGGIGQHLLHVPGRGPDPCPLLLLHGWPGSVFEFLDIIPMLTDPAAYGGDARDSVTVVAPSLPGYGPSFRPGQRRMGVEEMADQFAELMTALGYDRFAVQGGDWGASIGARMALAHPDRLLGLHLNMMPLPRDPDAVQGDTPEERAYLDNLKEWLAEGTGYADIQGTRPQTLAYAMTDSPAGLAAWIADKFRDWTDCGGDPNRAVPRDHMLADITLYWLTGAIGSSFWPYYARRHGRWPIPPGATIAVPTGYAAFPAEIVRPPRSLAERTFTDLRRWTAMPRGGHFAALEQPALLAGEMREFLRPLRGMGS